MTWAEPVLMLIGGIALFCWLFYLALTLGNGR